MGRRQGARSGASRTTFCTPGTLGLEGSMKVVRDVTDEQRGRRPIFIATLRAGASWPFFCVALSARPAPFLHRLRNGHTSKRQKWGGMGARSRLEKQPTDFRQNICYFGDRTLVNTAFLDCWAEYSVRPYTSQPSSGRWVCRGLKGSPLSPCRSTDCAAVHSAQDRQSLP